MPSSSLLEIEVKNVSTKRIYYIEIDVNLPDVVISELDGASRSLVIPLMYGRRQLMRNDSRATPEDMPIRPGERYTFKIPKQYWEIHDRLAGVKRVGFRSTQLALVTGRDSKRAESHFL